MLLATLMFAIGTGTVLGAYALYAYLPVILERRQLQQRLDSLSSPLELEGAPSLVKRAPSGPVPGLDRFLAESQRASGLVRLIEQSGVDTTPSAVVLMCLGCGLVLYIVGRVMIPLTLLPLAFFAAGAILPILFLRFRKARRMARFEEQFPEALDLLSRALRAGHAFQTAMGMVADDLKEPCGPEFRKTFDQQNFGLPLRDSLFQLADRMPLLDVRFFVTAVLIQRDTGGNLAEILDNLAHVVRERFRIRREIRTKTAHGRFTGLVLTGLPAALGAILTVINPEHMALLFKHPTGQTLIMVAIGMQTVGYLWIRKILNIEV
jgi:tight adherence protein B